jgi:hypothetical protein
MYGPAIIRGAHHQRDSPRNDALLPVLPTCATLPPATFPMCSLLGETEMVKKFTNSLKLA